jgi:hypothetical protein
MEHAWVRWDMHQDFWLQNLMGPSGSYRWSRDYIKMNVIQIHYEEVSLI